MHLRTPIAAVAVCLLAACATPSPGTPTEASTDSPGLQANKGPTGSPTTKATPQELLDKAQAKFLAAPRRQQRSIATVAPGGHVATFESHSDIDAAGQQFRSTMTATGISKDPSAPPRVTTAIVTPSVCYLTASYWAEKSQGKWVTAPPEQSQELDLGVPDISRINSTSPLALITPLSATSSPTGQVIDGTMSLFDALPFLSLNGPRTDMGLTREQLGVVPVKVLVAEGKATVVEIAANQATTAPEKILKLLRSTTSTTIELTAPADFPPITVPSAEQIVTSE